MIDKLQLICDFASDKNIPEVFLESTYVSAADVSATESLDLNKS